jgi:hypothetical protein
LAGFLLGIEMEKGRFQQYGFAFFEFWKDRKARA